MVVLDAAARPATTILTLLSYLASKTLYQTEHQNAVIITNYYLVTTNGSTKHKLNITLTP